MAVGENNGRRERGLGGSVAIMFAVDDKAGFLVVNGTRCKAWRKLERSRRFTSSSRVMKNH